MHLCQKLSRKEILQNLERRRQEEKKFQCQGIEKKSLPANYASADKFLSAVSSASGGTTQIRFNHQKMNRLVTAQDPSVTSFAMFSIHTIAD